MESISRRRALLGLGGGAVAVAAAACSASGVGGAARTTTSAVTPTTIPLTPAQSALGGGTFRLFAQADLDFQTQFALGEAGQNACAGEVLAVVAQANAAAGGATYQSVYDAFLAQANRLQEQAIDAQRAGRTITAQSRFIRSAKYYAQALYWVFGTSTPDANRSVCEAMDGVFEQGMRLRSLPTEQVSIPYENSTLPGWFLKPADDSKRRPTIIMNNGSDGQNVDMLAQGGEAALARGYNVLIFEGPGQCSQLFVKGIPFRPDWNAVLTPVVDYLVGRKDVDPKGIAARGISFGGMLVPQAAAHDDRFAAIVADPGSVDNTRNFPPIIRNCYVAGDPVKTNANWQVIAGGATPVEKFDLIKPMSIYSREAYAAACKGQLVTDFFTWYTDQLRYAILEEVPSITSPTLVTQYEGDTWFGTMPDEMFKALTVSRKELVRFTTTDGAQGHCGPLAPQVTNEACWDFVDGVLGR